MTCLLIVTTSLNALFLFTHTKLFHLFLQPDPVAFPHPHFVSVPTNLLALVSHLHAHAWAVFLAFWRFLLGITPSSPPGSSAYGGMHVQELEVWTPGEGEFMFFFVYLPIHVFLHRVHRAYDARTLGRTRGCLCSRFVFLFSTMS